MKKIIVEGLWGVGKTTVSKEFAKENNFKFISEVTLETSGKTDDEINKEYSIAHSEKDKSFFESEENIITERSLLASIAFLYATRQDFEKYSELILSLVEYYKNSESMVVFMYGDIDILMKNIENLNDERLKDICFSEDFVNRYDHFFRNVLPFKYGITPLCIDVFEKKSFKPTGEIVNIVKTAIDENRVAQINVVCVKDIDDDNKFLVLKRNEKKGGFWQTITGGIHLGELLSDNVLREVGEEISINPESKDLISTGYTFNYIGGEGYELNEYVFGYKIDSNDNPVLSEEHTDMEFLDSKNAQERVKYDGNKVAIEEVNKYLTRV